MFMNGSGKNPFVCIDDITKRMESLNSVIYNTTHSVEVNKRRLHSIVKERFNIELTEEQLDRLTKYDRDHLSEFIDDLRQIIRDNKSSRKK